MLKKAIVAGGAVALLSGLAVSPLASYTRCGVSWLQDSASDAVPLEWELKRARQMISDLKPEIASNAKRIAYEKIEVSKLQKQLSETESRLAKAETDIQRLTDDLEGGNQRYTYAGKTYTSVQVRDDLKNRFKRFKTRRATADKLQQMLDARQATLAAAQQRMDEMLGARRQLEVEVENLQARLGALRVAQTANELSLDDSHLSQTRQLLDTIATRIDVEEETMEVDAEYFGGGIQLDGESDETLLEDIANYFGGEKDSSTAMVAIQLD